MLTSNLGYARAAAAEVLGVSDFGDAYKPSLKVERVRVGLHHNPYWFHPPYLPEDNDVYAPGEFRVRFVVTGRTPLIAKFHPVAATAIREVRTARRIATEVLPLRTSAGGYKLLFILPSVSMIPAENGTAWVVEPFIGHVGSLEQVLRERKSWRNMAIVAICEIARVLGEKGLWWRGFAPRNILLAGYKQKVAKIALCDFERGAEPVLASNFGARLEHLSFCLEEFTNLLTNKELTAIFGAELLDYLHTHQTHTSIPTASIDSKRQLLLSSQWFPHSYSSGRLSMRELELIREKLRWWQRLAMTEHGEIDPLPLLDGVCALLPTTTRLSLTEATGEASARDRARVMARMHTAAKLLTVLDLCLDASLHGFVAHSSQFDGSIPRQLLVDWLLSGRDKLPQNSISEVTGLKQAKIRRIVEYCSA